MTDTPRPPVAPLSDALLARGHDLTRRVRDVEADLSAWMDELPTGCPERADAEMHVESALLQMQQARNAIAVFTQIAAGLG